MGDLTQATQRYLAADKKLARKYQFNARAPGTFENHKHAWREFSNYLGSADPWKATPEDVSAHIAGLAAHGYSTVTIKNRLTSLKVYYKSLGKGFERGEIGKGIRKDNPADTEIVRATLRGIQKMHGAPPRRKAALMLDSLDKMIDLQPDTLRGIRNRAMLSLGWAAAARPSEISGFGLSSDGRGVGHVEFIKGGLVIVFNRRKNHPPYDFPRRLTIPARIHSPNQCPSVLLRRWLDASGIDDGAIFRGIQSNSEMIMAAPIGSRAICRMVQASAEAAGLDGGRYSTQSLRIGCITWLAQEGLSVRKIMEHSGHKRVESVMTYIRPVATIEDSALAGTRWCC